MFKDYLWPRLRECFAASAVVTVCGVVLSGCRSGAWHHEASDREILSITDRIGSDYLERDAPYRFETPAEDLRRRLLLEQDLPTGENPTEQASGATVTPPELRLADGLRIGAGHNAEYQNRKEAIFRAALALDVEAEAFRTSWAGILSGRFQDDQTADPGRRGLSMSAEPTVSRLFAAGVSVTTRLAFDLARLLTLDRDTAYGLLADASVSVPLLRGAGRRILLEPVTLAERQVVYAMYDFERHKQGFAVRVASEYLAVLERAQQIVNAEDNYRRLELSTRRAENMADAGRLPATQVDQTRQDLLRARERLVGARRDYQRQFDELKRTLGLPVDAEIRLDESELDRLAAADATPEAGVVTDDALPDWDREPGFEGRTSRDIVRLALDNRLDLRRMQGRLEDARRAVDVARDALRGNLKIDASASYGERRDIGSADQGDVRLRPERGRYRAVIEWEAPWQRVRERNRYRESLLDLERARRELADLEDAVKQQIRDHLRGLNQARESMRIQQRAVQLAERRVESSELFLQAGRAQIRDVLEAQEALVSARNALLAASVRYRTTVWNLHRDMDLLRITDEGIWHEDIVTLD